MIDAISHFHFIRPAWLLLAPAALVLWWMHQRFSDPLRGWREQITGELLDALTVGRDTAQKSSGWWLLTGWLLSITAIAGPTWQLEPNPFADDTSPLLILLKADLSMETPDPAPSQLERARLKISDLAEARKGQPLGLIAYAGSAHLVLPPTRDTAIVATMASEISSEIMPVPGDRLDLALKAAAKVFAAGEPAGSILVVADSADVDPSVLQAFRETSSIQVQFLDAGPPDAAESSLLLAAKTLGAVVVPMEVDGRDVSDIIRRAASTPIPQTAELMKSGERWQESGYWLVPVGLIVLLSFRREEHRSCE